MVEQRCGTCRFWLSDGQNAICRRFPPQTFLMSAQDVQGQYQMKTTAAWPVSTAAAWCGEWRNAESATVTVLHPAQMVGPIQDQPGPPEIV